MSLREAAREALSIKCDVECFNALSNLRRECREKGLDADRVNKIIRSVNHESSRDKQHTESVSEPKPAETEQVQELPKLQKETKQLRRDIPPRARAGKVSPSGTTITGSYGGPSIIDMAEGRG